MGGFGDGRTGASEWPGVWGRPVEGFVEETGKEKKLPAMITGRSNGDTRGFFSTAARADDGVTKMRSENSRLRNEIFFLYRRER